MVLLTVAISTSLLFAGCRYRFSGAAADNPFPADVKTVVLESAVNNTTITGIETELTNDVRREFALSSLLKPVRSGGDVTLKTVISSYADTPVTYRADGKELTRIGTLSVTCTLKRAKNDNQLWQKDLSASYAYTVTDTISQTLSNRRKAISQMIKDLTPRIQRSMYDNF
jgi:hypothetical protein